MSLEVERARNREKERQKNYKGREKDGEKGCEGEYKTSRRHY